jgi:hypothetical protein
MPRFRLSFTERRRARLARKIDRLDRLETKNTITEPISVTGLSVTALRGIAGIGLVGDARPGACPGALGTRTHGAARHGATIGAAPHASAALASSLAASAPSSRPVVGGGASAVHREGRDLPSSRPAPASDWLTMRSDPTATETGISKPRQPASPPGGGAALAPRGGSGAAPLARGTIQPVRVAVPPQAASAAAPASSAAASAALLSAFGLSGSARSATAPSPAAAAPVVTRNAAAVALGGGTSSPIGGLISPATGTTPAGGGAPRPTQPVSPLTSPAFELVTLDYNDGSVMVPGFDQLATPGGSVDLRAQVRDSATGTYTFSWNTSGLTDANTISGTATYDLTFDWNTSVSTAKAESVTLTVTDPGNNQVSQTYTFWVPAASGTATGGTTWNNQPWTRA